MPTPARRNDRCFGSIAVRGLSTVLAFEDCGRGPLIALLHGFTQSGRMLSAIAAALSSQYRARTIDLPGHGASRAVIGDLPAAAREVAAVLDAPAAVIGYSMGGRVALRLALDHPKKVRALALIGASPGLADPRARAERRDADAALADRLEQIGLAAFLDEWLAQPIFAGLPRAAQAREERLANDARALAAALRALSPGAQEPLWDRLSELTMPVLLLTGERDLKLTAVAEAMSRSIRAPLTRVIIPSAGHAVPFEQPEACVRALSAWLGAAGAPASGAP